MDRGCFENTARVAKMQPAQPRRQAGIPFRPLTKVASGSYHIGMRAVGLKVLKNKLSEYVRLAAAGETVLVTDRDTVVAEIVPPRPGRSPMLADAWLAEAVRKGWVTPPALASDAAVPRKPIMPFSELARDIETDRADR